MRTRPVLVLLLLCIALGLAACIPSTRATIELGNGYPSTEIDRIDALLEKLGFSRSWFAASNGERAAHIEREGKLISSFVTEAPRGFGAGVLWSRDGGKLTVEFAEYNTRFSEDGKQRLQALVADLRQIYGQSVTLVE
jgi:hypothetical protein